MKKILKAAAGFGVSAAMLTSAVLAQGAPQFSTAEEFERAILAVCPAPGSTAAATEECLTLLVAYREAFPRSATAQRLAQLTTADAINAAGFETAAGPGTPAPATQANTAPAGGGNTLTSGGGSDAPGFSS